MRPYKLVAMSVKLSNDGQYRRVDEKMTVKRDRLWSVAIHCQISYPSSIRCVLWSPTLPEKVFVKSKTRGTIQVLTFIFIRVASEDLYPCI